ncbi:alpha/beta hydrolase [Labedella endophytica]|uniref:Esterase n=1 Tax=Labedella endophytica TaxID=1523160 RepID=A0A3S0X757_9MICO|nr:alpha/beta hydrolase-fold protein [Labedella endophytica]RUR00901.1 hypothetical protein ELQ94_04975 [Labedella endophytica]
MDPDAPIHLPPALAQDTGADLLSTYWPAAIGLCVAIGGVALAVRAARRRGSRPRRRRVLAASGWSAATAVVLVGSLALGVNTWVGYFPSGSTLSRWVGDKIGSPQPDSGASGGRVTSDTHGHAFRTALPSTAEQVPPTSGWVYLPPDYDEPGRTTRYPVVYALHGSPGSAADWFTGGRIDSVMDALIDAGALPPTIVVSPDLNAGSDHGEDEPLDRPGGPQVETFVTTDVVSWADTHLRTLTDPTHRIIAGMSSGGLGALLYGLHDPEEFGGIVSIMPYEHPYTVSIRDDPDALRRNSPLSVIAARSAATDQTVFLGQGDGEPTTEATQIRDSLRAQGQTTTLRVLPGLGHTWTAARTIMPYGLVWTAEHLGWTPSGSGS